MADGVVPSLTDAHTQFAAWTETRSRETARAYHTAVARFFDFLREQETDPDTVSPTALPETILETFFQWLATRSGRSTTGAYLAGTRAFFRLLDRRGWGPNGTSYEKLSGNLRDAVGRESPYPTPRTDPAIARLAVAARQAELPDDERDRLTVLRGRAAPGSLVGADTLRRLRRPAKPRARDRSWLRGSLSRLTHRRGDDSVLRPLPRPAWHRQRLDRDRPEWTPRSGGGSPAIPGMPKGPSRRGLPGRSRRHFAAVTSVSGTIPSLPSNLGSGIRRSGSARLSPRGSRWASSAITLAV